MGISAHDLQLFTRPFFKYLYLGSISSCVGITSEGGQESESKQQVPRASRRLTFPSFMGVLRTWFLGTGTTGRKSKATF